MSQIRNPTPSPTLPALTLPARPPPKPAPAPDTASAVAGATSQEPAALQDVFHETGAPAVAPPSPRDPAQVRQEAALRTFQERLTQVFGLSGSSSAEDLALGKTDLDRSRGDTVSPEQQKQLLDASKELLLDLPLSSLSKPATARAKAYLDTRGVDTAGFEQKTLRELGPIGADLAKRLASDLKSSTPGAYYGLAAAGAVAVGAYGAAKGADALGKLGIKPEFELSLFNDQIQSRAEASWGEKLKDPNLTLDAEGTFKLNPATTLRASARGRIGGASLDRIGVREGEVDVALEREGTSLSGNARLGARGQIQGGAVQARTSLGSVKADAVAHLGAGGALSFGEATLTTEQTLGPARRDAFRTRLQGNVGDSGRFAGVQAEAQYTRRTPTQLHVQGALRTDGAMTLTHANAQARLNNDTYSLGIGTHYDRPGDELGYRVEGRVKTGVGLDVRGEADFDRRFAFERGSLSVEGTPRPGTLEGLNLHLQSNFVEHGRFAGATGAVTYDQSPWRVSAALEHNVLEQRSTGTLVIGHTPRPNLDIQVRGSLDDRGESRIGAGVVWRF